MFNLKPHIDYALSASLKVVLLAGLTLIGLVWLSIGLYAALSQWLGPIWGPILLGGVFFVPVVIMGIGALVSPPKPQAQGFASQSFTDNPILGVSKVIDAMSGHSPILATLAAVAAGFLATRFPSLLSLLAQALTALSADLNRRNQQKDAQKAAKAAEEEVMPPPPPDIEPIEPAARPKKKSKK